MEHLLGLTLVAMVAMVTSFVAAVGQVLVCGSAGALCVGADE